MIKLIKLIKNKSILPAIIFIISISINAQAQSAGKFQFSSNLISGNNSSRSFPTYANSHINYKIGAVSYGVTTIKYQLNDPNIRYVRVTGAGDPVYGVLAHGTGQPQY